MDKKINSLEGIRTIAWVGVFMSHFRGSFLPDFTWIGDMTPLKIMTAGEPFVRILFVLSGFVISYKYFTKREYESVPKDIVKRYFRLAPSIAIANIVVYFMMRMGLLYNVEAAELSGSNNFLALFNNFTPDIRECLKEGLVSCYLTTGNSYIGPLWTMQYEFLGSILVLSAIYIFKNNKVRFLFYAIVLGLCNSYYNYFVLGMLICDVYTEQDLAKFLRRHKHLNTALFLLAVMIVGWTSLDDTNKAVRVIFGSGIFVLFLSLLNSSWSEKILGNRLMQKGGKIAYAAYIVHWPIIESFSSALYIWGRGKNLQIPLLVSVDFALTFILICLVSCAFAYWVEPLGNGAVKYISENYEQYNS